VAALRETIITFFEASMVDDQLVLPWAKQELLGAVYENARLLSQDYDATGRIMDVRGLPAAIASCEGRWRLRSSTTGANGAKATTSCFGAQVDGGASGPHRT
jgi:hypothetical protein